MIYTDEYLVTRLLMLANEKSIDTGKLKIKPPNIKNENRKTIFKNFIDFCEDINRPVLSVQSYLHDKFGINTSISDDGLIFDSICNSGEIIKQLKNFISEFVICNNCKSGNTTLEKKNRIMWLICKSCNSSVSIQEYKNNK